MGRALVVLSFLFLPTAPAAAQQPGPEEPTIAEVEPARARAGSVVEVRGTGWEPGSRVQITYQRKPLGFATVSRDGRWETAVTVPNVDPPVRIPLSVTGTSVTGEVTTFDVLLDVETGTPRGTWIVLGVLALVILIVLVLGWVMLIRQGRAAPTQRVTEAETPVRSPNPRREPQLHDGRR